MRPLFPLIGLLAATALTSPGLAQQPRAPVGIERMTFQLVTNDPEAPREKQIRWVSARGGIVRETPKDFEDFLKVHDITGLTIFFDSPGGSIAGGIALGEKLRRISAKVSIGRSIPVGPSDMQGSSETPPLRRHQLSPNAGQCNSSCAYAFLGGTSRSIPAGAHYGVHMFWPSEKVEQLHQQTYGPKDIENAQRTASRIASYIQRMDVDLKLFEIASSTPHKGQMRRLSPREITELKVASIEHTTPLLAREGNWGLVTTRANATLLSGGALRGEERAGANYQIEFSCNATRGFHNARFELSIARPLPDNGAVVLRRVLIVSGNKDAVLAISGKDIRAMPATFNRLAARGQGGWVAKAGTVVSEVLENALTRPADGLSVKIEEGDDSSYVVPLTLGNFGEQYRLWARACEEFREKRTRSSNESDAVPATPGEPRRRR